MGRGIKYFLKLNTEKYLQYFYHILSPGITIMCLNKIIMLTSKYVSYILQTDSKYLYLYKNFNVFIKEFDNYGKYKKIEAHDVIF